MGRRIRTTIVLIALGLMAITAMTAQAKPMSSGIGQDEGLALGIRGQTSDDQAGYPEWATQMEAPYWFSKSDAVLAPDDLSLSRPKPVETTLVVSDDGRNVDFNAYTVTGFVLALLLAIGAGMGVGVWYSRRSRLSPA
jgi:hypothetical protein